LEVDRDTHEVLEDHERAADAAESRNRFAHRAAVLVGALAALLAIATLLGNQASEEILLNQELATDAYNEYQADSIKQRIGNNDAALLDAQNLNQQAAAARKDAQTRGARLPGLLQKAEDYQHERDAAHAKHRSYQLAEGAFQIGIVLVSIAIVARMALLAYVGGGLGAAGLLLLLNGPLQVLPLPGR